MPNRKIAVVVLICTVAMFSLLLLSNCQARRPGPTFSPAESPTASFLPSPTTAVSVTPSPTASATTAVGVTPSVTVTPATTFTDELPIIIARTDYHNGQGGKATIHLISLNYKGYYKEIVAENVGDISGPVMDDNWNIYIPVKPFDPFGRSDIVLHVIPRHDPIKRIELDTEEISSSQYCYGRMVFAGRGVNKIVIMEKDLSYRIVKLKTFGSNIAIGGLVKGEENRVIAFNQLPVEENGKQFAEIFIIDLNSGEITRKLLPAPPSEELSEVPISPTIKYNLLFIGVSRDLKKLYYSYFETEESENNALYTRLGMFDTENKKELHAYNNKNKCCPPPDGYQQYKEYLFVSHSSEAGGSALLLSMKDLSPVVDLHELLKGERTSKILIVPFGERFIVGTQSKVLLLSQDGHILKEYPLPPDLIGKNYAIVEYLEDD